MRKTSWVLSILVLGLAAGSAFARTRVTETETAAAIQDRLYHARTFQHGQVQVDYAKGVATLTGTVESLGARQDAERAARKIENVSEVVDRIDVRADDVTPQQIVEAARKEVVTYYAYGIFDNISLQAQGDKLIVNGQVSQPFKKSDIGNFLAHVKGVAELENNLEVLPNSLDDDRIRLAIARAIYRDPYFVHYATQATPSIHIIVKNGNVELDGVVASQVDRAKAETDARFAATYFGLTDNLRVENGKA